MFSNQRNNHVYGAWEKYWCNQFNFCLVNHLSISFVSHKSETKYLLLCNSYQHFFFSITQTNFLYIYIYNISEQYNSLWRNSKWDGHTQLDLTRTNQNLINIIIIIIIIMHQLFGVLNKNKQYKNMRLYIGKS